MVATSVFALPAVEALSAADRVHAGWYINKPIAVCGGNHTVVLQPDNKAAVKRFPECVKYVRVNYLNLSSSNKFDAKMVSAVIAYKKARGFENTSDPGIGYQTWQEFEPNGRPEKGKYAPTAKKTVDAPTITKTTGTSTSCGPSCKSANRVLGKQMAAKYGWGSGAQWTALNNLVMSESGWSDVVENKKSSAAGIAQNIRGFSSSYSMGDAEEQIGWMLTYIEQRYGSPVNACKYKYANTTCKKSNRGAQSY